MIKNTILSVSIVLSTALALSILAKADFGTQAFAQGMTLNAADQGISDQSAKMHLDEGIKALKGGDQQGALMHLGAADQALGGSGG